MKWIALFSQTGSEIANLSEALGRFPDVVLTTNKNLKSWDKRISEWSPDRVILIDSHANHMKYLRDLSERALVTMHGYLRIVPDDVCNMHDIINGHPGDIVEFPQLKGKDPQKKALELKLPSTGVVLHKAVAEVDAGEIVLRAYHPIQEGTDENQLISDLKRIQLVLWTLYLKDKL